MKNGESRRHEDKIRLNKSTTSFVKLFIFYPPATSVLCLQITYTKNIHLSTVPTIKINREAGSKRY